jgi:hypothetical protein
MKMQLQDQYVIIQNALGIEKFYSDKEYRNKIESAARKKRLKKN